MPPEGLRESVSTSTESCMSHACTAQCSSPGWRAARQLSALRNLTLKIMRHVHGTRA